MADPQPNNDATREEMLDRVIDKVLELQRTGATISLEECVAQYPELEHELRELLPAIHMAENLRPLPLSTIRTVGSYAKSPDTLLQRNSERFKILRALDRGGLGVVSVAIDQELHREVAVKEIREDRADDQGLRAKFILEAEVTGGLEHPGIVPVYALGASEAGRPFYAMRLIRGNNFRDHIRRFHEQVKAKEVPFNGPQLRQLVRRFLVACEAIDYAHSRGVLHRDLKPSNIMVGSFGETLVVDWGLAKATGTSGVLLEHASQSSTAVMERLTESELPIVPSGSDDATREGTAIGTPGYAPPEQLLGRSDSIGVHSDVYGLGAILYELLTNAPPASGSLSQILEKVTKQGIPSSRSVQPLVPKPIDAICSKALSLHPSARYSTVGLFRKDVEQWLDDEPVSSYAEPWRARARRWFKQHQTLTTSLVAVGFMAILGSFLIAFLVSQSNAELRHLNSVLDRTNTELISANRREMSSRTEAEKREKAERFERYRTNLSATISSKQVDNRPMMASSLASAPQEFRNWEWQHFQSQMEELSTIYRGGSHICPKTLKRAVIRDDHQVVIVDPDPNVPEITIAHPNSRIVFVRFRLRF